MKDESAGLLAAAFMGIVPGYISRSVAGSYDNEAIAIFLLMFTFYSWIKALKQGSAFFGTVAAVFYFYMVAAWGMSWEASLAWCPVLMESFPRWLCIHHQHDSTSRPGPRSHGALHISALCCIFVVVRYRYTCKHAGPLRRLPACKHKRAYGSSWCVSYASYSIPVVF